MAKQSIAVRNLRKRLDVLAGKLETQEEVIRAHSMADHRIGAALERIAAVLENGRARCVRSRKAPAPGAGDFATSLPAASALDAGGQG